MGRGAANGDTLSLADRLQAAMTASGLTRRGLAVKLAGGTADKTQVERYRTAVRRILRGEQKTVLEKTAAKLSEVLDVPIGYWPTERSPRPQQPVELAEELLRRLDEGEAVPPPALESAAAQLDETALLYGEIAARLRASAAAEGSTP